MPGSGLEEAQAGGRGTEAGKEPSSCPNALSGWSQGLGKEQGKM